MKNALVLFSGGLDSTTCLALAKSQGFNCHALSFNYGQKHAVELNAAKKIAAHYECEHIIIDLPKLSGSALTDKDQKIPDYNGNQTIPVTYVPARNLVFLSLALSFAESMNASDIFMGASSIDYSGYPDCRPAFFNAFQKTAALATKIGTEGKAIKIHTPLIFLSKAETIKLGLSLGVNYGMTISCYQANKEGLACGKCDSCILRVKGFNEAHCEDPTSYSVLNINS